MLRTELSLNSVGRISTKYDYLKGVYARDVGGVLRKLALLNSSSIMDIGENIVGKEVPVDIHGLDTHGLRIFAGGVSSDTISLFHDDSNGHLNTSAGRLIIDAASGVSLNGGSLAYAVMHSDGAAVDGGLRWDAANHKLQIHNGTAWETVTSA